MASIPLFPRQQIVGIFRGFREGGLEFHADLVLPYRNDFQCIPMHGQFLLVQLETPEQAVLGRIASLASDGKLSTEDGEDFHLRALREGRTIPEDLREEYLKYRVNIRVLGVLSTRPNQHLAFVPSHRRLPHVGSLVAFPSAQVLQEIVGHHLAGAAIGHFALGEYIYAADNLEIKREDWMQIRNPEVLVRFPIHQLVARRSFIFARAGFGKSNLNKLLFSELYAQTPTVTKRHQREVPVGTIVFDPDGEYFWPDDKGRPGLCDVPHLQEQLVVFTDRTGPSPFYHSFVAGGIRLDLRRLPPADVIAIALAPDKQEHQNVRKLKGLDQYRWERLVSLIERDGHQTDLETLHQLLNLEPAQQAEALAARANMTAIVHALHDSKSQVLDMLLTALAQGKLCVVDVSQMRGTQARILSGFILRKIFDRNLAEFTKVTPQSLPTIAVIEEAQSVLQEDATAAEPYLTWVKEGRKFDLGCLLITQQPGSIPTKLLSQGDNWFLFHLLSAADLSNIQKANAHFSQDILSVLLNEPLPGQGVFWSSGGGKPYPISVRVFSFEEKFPLLDPLYERPAVKTFAKELKAGFQAALHARNRNHLPPPPTLSSTQARENRMPPTVADPHQQDRDYYSTYKTAAIEALCHNNTLLKDLRGAGIPWGVVLGFLYDHLPDILATDERKQMAHHCVREALDGLFGPQDEGWYTYKRERSNGTSITIIRAGKKP